LREKIAAFPSGIKTLFVELFFAAICLSVRRRNIGNSIRQRLVELQGLSASFGATSEFNQQTFEILICLKAAVNASVIK